MKISKSKRQLAQLLIEAGVKQFPEGANWVAQDKDDSSAWFQGGGDAPKRGLGNDYWDGHKHGRVKLSKVIPNWHQAALSRAEFDQIVAESAEQSKPDADGWIEWGGGECPVGVDDMVNCKGQSGVVWNDGAPFRAGTLRWDRAGLGGDIYAYRICNQSQ